MTGARRKLVDPTITRWYHCISRCVCRAFLLEGQEGAFDRKSWLHERLKQLTDVFAVAGFAILDNHLHVLTRLDPHLVDGWSDEEVARRWGRLYPPRKRRKLVPLTPEWIQKRAGDPQWVAKMSATERCSRAGSKALASSTRRRCSRSARTSI